MKHRVGAACKYFLTFIGARLPGPVLHRIQLLVNYMQAGHWMSAHGFHFPRRVYSRADVFESVSTRVRDTKALYLEFGVFEGNSMRYWSRALRHPEATLVGFDSFEGLPEDFDLLGPYRKGAFDVGGVIPRID